MTETTTTVTKPGDPRVLFGRWVTSERSLHELEPEALAAFANLTPARLKEIEGATGDPFAPTERWRIETALDDLATSAAWFGP